MCVLREKPRDMDLRRTAANDQRALLDEAAYDTERVVQTALALLKHDVATAHAQYTDGTPWVAHAGDLDNCRLGLGGLFDEVGIAELLLGESVNVGDGLAPKRFGQERDLVTLDVLDDEDLELGEEVQRDVVDGVAQDRLLDEQDVAAPLLDLLAELKNVSALLLDDLVHLPVVVDDDRVIHVGLRSRELELNHRDLGLFHPSWTTSGGDNVLVENDAVDKLGIFDRAADLLDDTDVAQVDVRGGRSNETGNCVDGYRCQQGRELRDDLRVNGLVEVV